MIPTFTQQAKLINEAALFFAERGYHVTTAFRSCPIEMEVIVYFERCDDRNMIESFMTLYEEENDDIDFNTLMESDNHVFHTITLTKHPS